MESSTLNHRSGSDKVQETALKAIAGDIEPMHGSTSYPIIQGLVYQGTISDDQDLNDFDEKQEVYDESVESDEDGREFDYGG